MSKSIDTAPVQDCGGFSFSHNGFYFDRPMIMGVLNVTPDSFSDGGQYFQAGGAIDRAALMEQQGAAIVDIGGESTRPGAEPVSEQQELDRVIPVIEGVKDRLPVLVSVDTSSPQVMLEAYKAGADLINDVRALQRPGALDVCSKLPIPVCLMHMQGGPKTMQNNPVYDSVVEEVKSFFAERILECEKAGIQRSRIMLDPGFGFGKTLAHNLSLLKQLNQFSAFNMPLLIGLSRKSMIGQVLDKEVDERTIGSVAGAMIAVSNGANIVRVHDVEETVDALKILQAVLGAK